MSSHTKTGSRLLGLLVVVPLIAALAACGVPLGGQGPTSTIPTSSGPAPTEVYTAELAPYYTQSVDWQPCDENTAFQCATIKVPLDWTDPAADSVDVIMAKQPATGTKIGTVFTNPGGPGGSGIDWLFGTSGFTSAVNASYDVIAFDPRGVSRSSPVSCFADSTGLDDYLYGDPDDDSPVYEPGEPGFVKDYESQVDDFADGCEKYTGPVLDHLDTWSVAQDMDVMRALAGDPKLNYVGYSYGTFIGADYVALFPEKTGRIVFDGVVNPLADSLDADIAQAKAFEHSLHGWAASCIDTGACTFGTTEDQVIDYLQGVIDDLDKTPLVNADGRELTGSNLLTGVIQTMYNQQYWPVLTQMLLLVEQGDPSYAFIVADAYNGRSDDGTYPGNITEVIGPVHCVDAPAITNLGEIEDRAQQLADAAPFWGQYFGYGEIFCKQWPVKYVNHQLDYTAPGSAPIVVVSTTGDPATPYQQGVDTAAQLSDGHLITYNGEQHTVYNQGVTCIDDAVDAYLVNGTLPADGLTC